MLPSLIIQNRYEIKDPEKEKIGIGGMGTVYRGVDLQTGQAVAVKHLKPEVVAADPEQVERFEREGQALRQLDHPNIVNVLATAEEAGQHYIVMEYVDGGSLRELMDRQPKLPLEQVVNIGLELADALARSHHLHIIHRDIKPANVLLAEDGTPRLTDFGIAHMGDQSRITQLGALTGTYPYLSPEAVSGEALDSRTDIWSFGVLLYEMLAGEHPFRKEQLAATLHAILNIEAADPRKFRPDAPPPLCALIEQMMVKDREERIGSVRLVGARLEAVQQGVDTPSELANGFRSRFSTPSMSTASGRRHNLPNQPTPFIGRTAELNGIAERLKNPACRLLSLIGPGGIGKTRLALKAAEAELSHYASGIFFVALAPLNSADSLVPTIAEAVGFSFYRSDDLDEIGPGPRQQLLDYLHNKQMLLVMDNFEHLLNGVNLLNDILETAPAVKLLVTSRERLNLQGEWMMQIDGMPFPAEFEPDEAGSGAEAYSAVQLFLDNARRIDGEFSLNDQNETAVVRICRLVEGMPLGIELAAAWVQLLTPAEIAREISTGLDFLATSMSNIPERHRSIRAVFEYSWTLLQVPERAFMGKLSVFKGGFTRQAAGTVAANGHAVETLPLLSTLVGKSLLQRRADGRYHLHELLRQFTSEKLAAQFGNGSSKGVLFQARDAHCRYYLNRLADREKDLTGRKQRETLDELEREIENIREAWRWAATNGREEQLAKAKQGLVNLYFAQNWLEEGAELFGMAANALIENQVDNRLLIAQLRAHEASYRYNIGEQETAFRQMEASLAEFQALDSALDVAFAYHMLGIARGTQGHLDEAKAYQEQSLEIYRRLGNKNGTAAALSILGFIANEWGHYEETERLQLEALALRRETGDLSAVVGILSNLGFVAYRRGDVAKARRYAEETLALNEQLNNRAGIASAIRQLGMVAGLEGDFEAAYNLHQENLAINENLGNPGALALSYTNLSHVTYRMGRYEDSEKYARELVRISEMLNNRWNLLYGRNNVALALIGLGRYEEARQNLLAGLEMARDMGAVPVALELLMGMASCYIHAGDKPFALELCAQVVHHPALIEETRELVLPVYEALTAELDGEVVKSAEARARERDVTWYWDELLK